MEEHYISDSSTGLDAIQKLNQLSGKALTLFVLDSTNKCVGTVTDGDVRRKLLEGLALSDSVVLFMYEEFSSLKENHFNLSELSNYRKKKIIMLPVLNEEGCIVKVVDFTKIKSLLPIEAIIMAGGKGTRLLPLTKEVPKPLLKVGDEAILSHNLKRLEKYGVSKISITVNYLADQIDSFIKQRQNIAEISSVHEGDELRGTVGSVSLVEVKKDTVLIMNSDLLTNIDFEDMYKTFTESNADLLVATVPFRVKIPYAVLNINETGVSSFEEKPEYSYACNAGIYMVKSNHLKIIPENGFYDATDLIKSMIGKELKVSHYPLLGYWLDIGKHDDFNKANEDIKHINFD